MPRARGSTTAREGGLLLGLVFVVAVAGAITAYGIIALCPCRLEQGFAPAERAHDANGRIPFRYWTAAH